MKQSGHSLKSHSVASTFGLWTKHGRRKSTPWKTNICSPLRIDGLEDEHTFWDGSFLGAILYFEEEYQCWNIDAIKTYSRNWNTAQYFGWPPRYSGESKINKHQTYHVRQKWTTSNKFSKIPRFWEPHHPAPITTQVIRLTCTTSKSLYWGTGGPIDILSIDLEQKTKRSSQSQIYHPTCQWLFHQLLCASSRLMTRMARPRVRFTWSLSESGGKNVFFVFMEKIFEKHGNVSTLPNKKTWKYPDNFERILWFHFVPNLK